MYFALPHLCTSLITVTHSHSTPNTTQALKSVCVPMLLLNSKDDPMTPPPSSSIIAGNPFLVGVLTRTGGHTAWGQGLYPLRRSFDNDALAAFLSAVEEARGEDRRVRMMMMK